jgi:hypothetical protein
LAEGFEALKTAYQVAATRYDNIYRSLWTIFSYMTVVSAAILSFGGQRFYGEPLTLLVSLPLLFWFWSTFLPLNRYGDQTLVNLIAIEDRISKNASVVVDHFSSFRASQSGGVRARHVIYVSMIVLHVVFAWSLYASVAKLSVGDRIVRELPLPGTAKS